MFSGTSCLRLWVRGGECGVEEKLGSRREILRVLRTQFRANILSSVEHPSSKYNMTGRSEGFQRKPREKEDEVPEEPEEVIRFAPQKEAVCDPKAVLG